MSAAFSASGPNSGANSDKTLSTLKQPNLVPIRASEQLTSLNPVGRYLIPIHRYEHNLALGTPTWNKLSRRGDHNSGRLTSPSGTGSTSLPADIQRQLIRSHHRQCALTASASTHLRFSLSLAPRHGWHVLDFDATTVLLSENRTRSTINSFAHLSRMFKQRCRANRK